MKNAYKNDLSKESLFRNEIFKELAKQGPVGLKSEAFMCQQNVRLKFRQQKSSGAAWTLTGNIHLNAHNYSINTHPDNPAMLSLIVHEVHHLRQGLLTALSVYGELDAWQVGFNFFQSMTGSQLNPILREILELPLCFSRDVLRQASKLMKTYSPGYRIDLLPLYPIPREIAWWVTRKEPEISRSNC
ncbi:MAG: hypothetical protein ABIJ65_10360 [Chloroflexota bacterium]